MKISNCLRALLAVLLGQFSAGAALVGPYAPDARTLHLWHFNDSASPAADATTATNALPLLVLNGATLGHDSFDTRFGQAASTLDGGPFGGAATNNIDAYLAPLPLVNGAGDNVAWSFADPGTRAFTFEAIVRIDFDPLQNLGPTAGGGTGRNLPLQILTGEQDGTGGGVRSWQFRLDPVGFTPNVAGFVTPLTAPALEFINIGGPLFVVVPLPTSGPEAILSNGWYHVAVTYNGAAGTADNLRLYWTPLEEGRSQANLLWSTNMALDLNASGAVDFTIGNTGRGTSPNGNFLGLIDEVRISSVARAADGMQFRSESVVINAQPTNLVVGVGQLGGFVVDAGGPPPLFYQWRFNGVNLPGAYDPILLIPNAQTNQAGAYDVVITNSTSAVTSSVALLTVRLPHHLFWDGTFSGDWESATFNWIDLDDSYASAAFGSGDFVQFDDVFGAFRREVNFASFVRPGSVVVDTEQFFNFGSSNNTGLLGVTGLTKRGSGVLAIRNNNAQTGPTVIEAGTVSVGVGAARGSLGSGAITNHGILEHNRSDNITLSQPVVGSGSLIKSGSGNLLLNGVIDWTGFTLINSGGLLIGDGGPVASFGVGPVTNHGILAITSSSDLVLTNLITGSGSLLQSGPGTLTLAAANTYTGLTTVAVGRLLISQDGALGTRDGLTRIFGGTSTGQVALTGSVVVGESFHLAGRQPVEPSGSAAHLLSLAGDNTVTGAITTETGGNQYNIEVESGLLILEGSYAQVSGTGDRFLNLQGAGEGLWTGGILNGTANTILTKRGSGAWTLEGLSTYSGVTLVSNGLLRVNGQIGMGTNATLVYAGATLAGLGTLNGPVGIHAGGMLAPGHDGIGPITINGPLALEPGSVTVMEVDRASFLHDVVLGLTTMECGGLLRVTNLAGAFVLDDTLQLFIATNYTGSFAQLILPSLPGGLVWDASQLATAGWIKVVAGNQPPVAETDEVQTPQDFPLIFPRTELLANDSDPENDLLSLTAVGPVSTNGAAVTLLPPNAIRYEPQPGFLGRDEFTYIIEDSQGHPATGRVVVQVTAPPLGGVALEMRMGAGLVELRWPVAATNFVLQSARDLNSQPLVWTNYNSFRNLDGTNWMSTAPASSNAAFFRLRRN